METGDGSPRLCTRRVSRSSRSSYFSLLGISLSGSALVFLYCAWHRTCLILGVRPCLAVSLLSAAPSYQSSFFAPPRSLLCLYVGHCTLRVSPRLSRGHLTFSFWCRGARPAPAAWPAMINCSSSLRLRNAPAGSARPGGLVSRVSRHEACAASHASNDS